MSFFNDHLERIIADYQGHPPLAVFLRGYFKTYPKLGSRDRRALSEAAFIYYRCKSFFPQSKEVTDVVACGYMLCNSTNVFLSKMLGEQLLQKREHAPEPAIKTTIQAALSVSISQEEWLRSMWQQPQLFIRIRKEKERIIALLNEHDIPYTFVSIPGNSEQDCLMLPNGAAIDKLLPEEAYVVQDWASQASMYQVIQETDRPQALWDVCSGAGGKSILLKDKLPPFQLLATDIRESILHNLKMRFRLYGLQRVKTKVVNSAEEASIQEQIGEQKFDLVLCDVPCSGSGTWARTPEQFHFFRDIDLLKFEKLQYTIARNASRHLAPGGILAYVTCSVFRRENEEVADRLSEQPGIKRIHQQMINGIGHKADCMFVSVFRKVLPDQ